MARLIRRNVDTAPGGDVNRWNLVFFNFIEDMITQGWRVLGSGDGISFENEDETAGSTGMGSGGGFHLFTQATAIRVAPGTGPLAENWGNVSGTPDFFGASWLRLVSPAAVSERIEFLFQLQYSSNPGTGTGLMVAMCKGAQRFNSGAGAWQIPDVSTGTALVISSNITQFNTSQNRIAHFAPNSVGLMHYIIGDVDDDYDWIFWTNRLNGSGFVFSTLGALRTIGNPMRSDSSVDPDPYVVLATGESSSSSTTDDWGNSNIFVSCDAGSPDRLEDRTSAIGNFEKLIASYGLGDPAAQAAGVDGHYDVACLRYGVNDSGGIQSISDGAQKDAAQDKNLVIPVVAVGRFGNQAGIDTQFFKGYLKNDFLHWSLVEQTPPLVQLGQSVEEARVAWGVFSALWSDETVKPRFS